MFNNPYIALYFTFMMTYVSPKSEPHPATILPPSIPPSTRDTVAKMFIWRVAATQIIVEQHVARVCVCVCVSVRDDVLNFIYDYVCAVSLWS